MFKKTEASKNIIRVTRLRITQKKILSRSAAKRSTGTI